MSDVDLATLIETVGIFTAGTLTGYGIGKRNRKAPAPPAPKYECGCGHDLSSHEPKTSQCKASVRVPKYNVIGDRVGFSYPACACQQYVGPKPPPDLKDLWPGAPEVA